MPAFEYSRWDGTQQFTPQSADQLFDQISDYLMNYGEEALPIFDQLEEQNPDLLDQLIRRGHVEKDHEGRYRVTPQGMRRVENKALEELFQLARRDKIGRHDTDLRGAGQLRMEESKPYQYGDAIANLNMHETLRNALARQGGGTPVEIREDDLTLYESDYQSSCATVVLLDMSGSMSRYGKYGQAKKVALALQALVNSRYTGDSLQFVGFYTYAALMTQKELFYSAPKPVSIYDSRVHLRINLDQPPKFVPEHFTNIQAGLQFARRILQRQAAVNKQIITITDGEPTAHLELANHEAFAFHHQIVDIDLRRPDSQGVGHRFGYTGNAIC